MAIEVRHSPSAQTAATANYEAALLQWGEAERRRQLAEQLQRDQLAQQAALSREGMSLQDMMQRRSIADAQKRQLVGIQGQYGLQDDQQAFGAEQNYYDRNQQVGMAQLGNQFNVENREDQQAFSAAQTADAQMFNAQQTSGDRQFEMGMYNLQQADAVNNAYLEQGLQLQGDEIQYDAQVRRQLQQFDREQSAVDAAFNNGQLTPQEYEQATRQVEQRRMNVKLQPPAPEIRTEDYIKPYMHDGKLVGYAFVDPETGQISGRNFIKAEDAKSVINPDSLIKWMDAENAKRIEKDGPAAVLVTVEDMQKRKELLESVFAPQGQQPQGGQGVVPPPVEATPEQIAQTTNKYGPVVQGMNPEAVKALAVKPPEIQERIMVRFPEGAAVLLSDFMLLPPNVQGDVLEATRVDYAAMLDKQITREQYADILAQAIASAAQPQGPVQ